MKRKNKQRVNYILNPVYKIIWNGADLRDFWFRNGIKSAKHRRSVNRISVL